MLSFSIAPRPSCPQPWAFSSGRLLNLWTAKQGFFAACAAIGVTLVFYIYVGLSGGITDGFDRFSGPIEPLQTTLTDPNYEPDLPPGAWTGVGF